MNTKLADVSLRVARLAGAGASLAAVIAIATGCAAPQPDLSPKIESVRPAAQVRASSVIKQRTKVSFWRIYQGYGQTVVQGFDASGKPTETVRLAVNGAAAAAASNAKSTCPADKALWMLKLHVIRDNHELALSCTGKPLTDTTTQRDRYVILGAMRALAAASKGKAQAVPSLVGPRTLWPRAGASTSCDASRTTMNTSCATMVEKCFGLDGCAGAFGRCVGDAVNNVDCILSGPTLTEQIENQKKLNELEKLKTENKVSEDAAAATAGSPPADEPSAAGSAAGEGATDVEGGGIIGLNWPRPWADNTEAPPADPSAPSTSSDPDPPADAPDEDPTGGAGAEAGEQAPSSEGGEGEGGEGGGEVVEDVTEDDPNPADPEVEASGDEMPDDGASAGDDFEMSDAVGEESLTGFSLHAATAKKPSSSSANRIGGSCRAKHVLQCGVRKGTSYCRCIPAR